MDNAQKAIMIGVGLFITIIVIAAVMLITGMGQDMLNSGAKQITDLSDNLSKQLYNDYNGKTGISGSEVISVIKTNYNKNGGITMKVGSDEIKGDNIGKVSTIVKANAKYTCAVEVTDNVVTAMTFTKEQ